MIRILISFVLAVTIADMGVKGNAEVLKTMFTVLGIVFSISMSLLLSFNLTKVLNSSVRKSLRLEITYTRKMLLWDFVLSTVFLVVALIWSPSYIRIKIEPWLCIDVELIALVVIGISLLYEIYNFNLIHKLHSDIEDAVIEEEIERRKLQKE